MKFYGDHLVYETHPFSPSTFRGTPAEGKIPGEDRMAWMAIDWCGILAPYKPTSAGFWPL